MGFKVYFIDFQLYKSIFSTHMMTPKGGHYRGENTCRKMVQG